MSTYSNQRDWKHRSRMTTKVRLMVMAIRYAIAAMQQKDRA